MFQTGFDNLDPEFVIFNISKKEKEKLKPSEFGVPRLKKFPLNTAKRVRSAESYFHFCPEADKELLARKILEAAKRFNIEIKSDTILEYAKK